MSEPTLERRCWSVQERQAQQAEAQVGHLLRHAREALIHDQLEDGCATRVRCRCRWRRAELSVEQTFAYGQLERIGLFGLHALV